MTLLIAIVCISFGLIIFLVLFRKSIIRPINNMVDSVRKVAEGDLTAKIDIISNDELGTLAHSFRTMTENLRSIVSDIREGSDQMASASTQIFNSQPCRWPPAIAQPSPGESY